MIQYYSNILIDQRTRCTRDGAAAILLGRGSWDPIYQDQNSDGDPDKVQEQFSDWLNTSIFEILNEERDDIQSNLHDAQEENSPDKIAACKSSILHCDDTIRRAKLILCDIDDELAKGAGSELRKDQDATEKTGQVHITLTSLKEWAKGRDYLTIPLDVTQAQVAPPALPNPEPDEPLLNSKGGMYPKTAKSFLLTFAVLLEAFLEKSGPQFKGEGGYGVNAEAIATMLCKQSLPCGTIDNYITGLSVSSIELRIIEVIAASKDALTEARPKKDRGTPKESKVAPTDSLPSDPFGRTRSQKNAPNNS